MVELVGSNRGQLRLKFSKDEIVRFVPISVVEDDGMS
jgi:hypothetical protein